MTPPGPNAWDLAVPPSSQATHHLDVQAEKEKV